jgi:Flp pilus assembly protein TadG
MSRTLCKHTKLHRRGAIAVFAAVLLVVMLGFVAFAVDVGYLSVTRTQMQNAADAAALAAAAYIPNDATDAVTAAQQFAGYQTVGGRGLAAESVQIEFGEWDQANRAFASSATPGNAVRVTCERSASRGGEIPLFFAAVLGTSSFDARASAVAMTNPRDIAFVVDLSGSMNNDTEPCWATSEINSTFADDGYPTIGNELMQQVYDDFGYGTFPGTLQYVGQPLGVAQDQYAYAEMTKNGGPLAAVTIDAAYRIGDSDTENTRRQKAYKWIIDNQIASATLMPNVKPTPISSDSASYAYWSRYLDFIIRSQEIKSTSSKGKPRPSLPVTLPPSQSLDRIDGMGNPYTDAFPSATSSTPQGYRNRIGFRTYVQFMMDFGRDKQPVTGQYVPLSTLSGDCPWRTETTDGGPFRFPPREQPTHAAKRAIIAALQVIKDRNQGVSDSNQRDWVSIVTFDRNNNSQLVQSITCNYNLAMEACASLQAVADDALSTATESGLIRAKNHIASPDSGGQGRRYTNKVVVFLTDGIPNIPTTAANTITNYITAHPSPDFYGSSETSKNAVLMQCMTMQSSKWQTFPVGLGLGTDYTFMDRSARLGGTAKAGESPRGSGNPAEYEVRLKTIFQNIISSPKARLVQ